MRYAENQGGPRTMVTGGRTVWNRSLRLGAVGVEFVTLCVGCRPSAPAPRLGAAIDARAALTAVERADAGGNGGGSSDGGGNVDAGAVAVRTCEGSNDVDPQDSHDDGYAAWEGKWDAATQHSDGVDPETTSTSPVVLEVSTRDLLFGLSTFVFADGHTLARGMRRPANCCHPLSSARIETHAKALARCCEIRLADQAFTADQFAVGVTIGSRTCDHRLTAGAWKTNATARRCREAASALQAEVCAEIDP